jgi:hypothetical protein
MGEGIQHRFQRIDPAQRLFEQSQRRDLLRIQQRRQRRGVQLPGHAFVSHWNVCVAWSPRTVAAALIYRECNPREEMALTRAYNVVDADGHILEPLNLWDDYRHAADRRADRRTVRA